MWEEDFMTWLATNDQVKHEKTEKAPAIRAEIWNRKVEPRDDDSNYVTKHTFITH